MEEMREEEVISQLAASTELDDSGISAQGTAEIDGETAQVYVGSTSDGGDFVAVRAAVFTHNDFSVLVVVQRGGLRLPRPQHHGLGHRSRLDGGAHR